MRTNSCFCAAAEAGRHCAFTVSVPLLSQWGIVDDALILYPLSHVRLHDWPYLRVQVQVGHATA